MSALIECAKCRGSGNGRTPPRGSSDPPDPCEACKGTGKVPDPRSVPPVKLRNIGTSALPIRASALTRLCECAGFLLMQDDRFGVAVDSAGEAAHTGTATGRMVELYHLGFDVRDAIAQTRSESHEGTPRRDPAGEGKKGDPFPLAKWEDAEFWFRRYADDKRNPRDIVVLESMECELLLTIDPAPSDPTGEPIHITGHPDQIRLDVKRDRWSMWDLKTGRAGGIQMVYEFAWQLAAYTLAAEKKFKRSVHPGGIIRARGYNSKGKPDSCDVFWNAPYSIDHCRAMMIDVAEQVAMLRAGRLVLTPGVFCQWCPGDGPQNCGETFAHAIEAGHFKL